MGIESRLLNSLAFDVMLHAGTLLAVMVYFRKKLVELIAVFFKGLFAAKDRKKSGFKLSLYIIIGTIPAVIAALLFEEQIEGIFRNPLYTGIMLIVFGCILWAADFYGKKKKNAAEMGIGGSIIAGLAQALSLIPGVSRSGITVTAGLFLGLKKEEAAEFAFLLSVPAIAGAFVFKLKDIAAAGADGSAAMMAAGFIAAAVAGFAAIAFLMHYIKKNSFLPFVVYRFALGAFIIGAVIKVF